MTAFLGLLIDKYMLVRTVYFEVSIFWACKALANNLSSWRV